MSFYQPARGLTYQPVQPPAEPVTPESEPSAPPPKRPLSLVVLITIVVVIIGGSLLLFLFVKHQRDDRAAKSAASNNTLVDKQKYSITDPKSIWAIVNKKRPLSPKTFAPDNLVVPAIPLRSNISNEEKYLRTEAAQALKQMADAARNQGVHLDLQSGYRPYDLQATLYESYLKDQGQAQADRESARAGYSEHQTGLAADLGGTSVPECNLNQCFDNTAEGKWLMANAYKYGFIIRYPSDKEAVTGYSYEPWHVRYVGTDLSNGMHAQNISTLEEFFGLGSAPSY